ncbi:MAG TPA: hypothetical protein VGC87_06825 [Pyrinomonadaceae bacterium]|jgi:hypothetical protein
MKLTNVELHIEELVLHGFAPSDRYRIGEMVERELARLFAEEGVPAAFTSGLETPRLDAGAFHVAANSRAEAVGAEVARAVYGGLKS